MTPITAAIDALVDGRRDLTAAEAAAAMEALMDGEATPAQAAAFLTALRLKGETGEEIVGLARAMRERALPFAVPAAERIVDVVGTGGDAPDTFNVSTAAAFVVAACGLPVAKHGNRAMSSACGSADVLEALGARIDLPPPAMARTMAEVGIGFLFAQLYHPAMKQVAPLRRELGFRTVFNILGPLTNPAHPTQMAVGVATPAIGERYAQVLGQLGVEHALVLHGQEGLDEVSPAGPTTAWELRAGAVQRYVVRPADFDIAPVPLTDVAGGDAAANAQAMRDVLSGGPGPIAGFVALNAGAALLAADAASTFAEGVGLAASCLAEGRAAQTLDRFITATQRAAEECDG